MNSQKSTYLTPKELKRYDNRQGFDLVSSRKVGLPVYKVTLQAICQIRKQIPPIEEYVLKAMDAGLNSEDIGNFLGLEQEILKDAMINLRRSEDIDLIAPEGSSMQVWQLTQKGKIPLKEAQTIVPEERTFEINFDGLLRKARWYEQWLLKPRDLRQDEIIEIDPSPNKPPELPDIKLKDVDEIISELEQKRRRKQEQQEQQDLLALKAIERRSRFFQPALALIYKAKESDEVQVAFAIDGLRSDKHEEVFAHSRQKL